MFSYRFSRARSFFFFPRSRGSRRTYVHLFRSLNAESEQLRQTDLSGFRLTNQSPARSLVHLLCFAKKSIARVHVYVGIGRPRVAHKVATVRAGCLDGRDSRDRPLSREDRDAPPLDHNASNYSATRTTRSGVHSTRCASPTWMIGSISPCFAHAYGENWTVSHSVSDKAR